MSINSLKPTFTNREGYLAWRNTWKIVYKDMSAEIRRRKHAVKSAQRAGDESAPKMQKELALFRSDARKMMTILNEAKLRRDRILTMRQQIKEQGFPMTIAASIVDVHYNKVHNEFAWMPCWTVKAKGKSFYVDHIDAQVPWSTRELTDGSTKGMLRFRRCILNIDEKACASLTTSP